MLYHDYDQLKNVTMGFILAKQYADKLLFNKGFKKASMCIKHRFSFLLIELFTAFPSPIFALER
jgi:hypothetical protein